MLRSEEEEEVGGLLLLLTPAARVFIVAAAAAVVDAAAVAVDNDKSGSLSRFLRLTETPVLAELHAAPPRGATGRGICG